jgi:hypothetical protein
VQGGQREGAAQGRLGTTCPWGDAVPWKVVQAVKGEEWALREVRAIGDRPTLASGCDPARLCHPVWPCRAVQPGAAEDSSAKSSLRCLTSAAEKRPSRRGGEPTGCGVGIALSNGRVPSGVSSPGLGVLVCGVLAGTADDGLSTIGVPGS